MFYPANRPILTYVNGANNVDSFRKVVLKVIDRLVFLFYNPVIA